MIHLKALLLLASLTTSTSDGYVCDHSIYKSDSSDGYNFVIQCEKKEIGSWYKITILPSGEMIPQDGNSI